MRKVLVISGLLALVAAAVTWWRDHRRFGAAYVNRVIDPWLVRHGIASTTEGEIGLLEHVGRKSGTVRVSPVHPVATETGFRIVVPLGEASQWARNVMAAGHCRLQVADVVHELDEPALVAASEIDAIPPIARRIMDYLGFRYLVLRRFAEYPGTLAEAAGAPAPAVQEAITVG